MDNTLDALRNLYVALGGAPEDVANLVIIPDLINAIAAKALAVYTAATAKELPSVTSADNNKVLTVVGGKWAKADLPE